MQFMPKIDPKVKEGCIRLAQEHQDEYSSLTAAAEAVARREGLGLCLAATLQGLSVGPAEKCQVEESASGRVPTGAV